MFSRAPEPITLSGIGLDLKGLVFVVQGLGIWG